LAALKPAYLIHGDDHGAIAQRRANLKALGEQTAGASGVQVLTGDLSSPAGVAQALREITFDFGLRVIIVDGAERFKQAEVEKHLLPAFSDMPRTTTVAFFAREEGRLKAPSALHAAVKRAHGQVLAEQVVKASELPRWTVAQAKRLSIQIDIAAAKALIAQVGPRQQRLLRELEKLQVQGLSSASAEQIEAWASPASQQQAFRLADALLDGDAEGAISAHLALAAQGEHLQALLYPLVARFRDAVAVAEKLAAGQSQSVVRRSLSMPPKAAERFVAQVARCDPDRLRSALLVLSDVELDLRGGAPVRAFRRPQAALSQQTLAIRAILQVIESG
jgi:DNA polymerase-3 subunit delta